MNGLSSCRSNSCRLRAVLGGRIERKFQRNAQSNDWGRMAVHFSSSKTVEWATPQDFFDKMNAEFGFTLDAAATAENAKCARYLAKVLRGIPRWRGRGLPRPRENRHEMVARHRSSRRRN